MQRVLAWLLMLVLLIPVLDARDRTARPSPADKGFLGSRRGLAVFGAVVTGVGVALLAKSGRTRQVSASNCSFYPAPLVPCAAAHTEKTRSGIQDGVGGGLLVGGLLTIYASMH